MANEELVKQYIGAMEGEVNKYRGTSMGKLGIWLPDVDLYLVFHPNARPIQTDVDTFNSSLKDRFGKRNMRTMPGSDISFNALMEDFQVRDFLRVRPFSWSFASRDNTEYFVLQVSGMPTLTDPVEGVRWSVLRPSMIGPLEQSSEGVNIYG